MKETINLALLITLLGIACYAAAAWNSPDWLAWMATRLLARRHALKTAQKAHIEAMEAWGVEIGVGVGKSK